MTFSAPVLTTPAFAQRLERTEAKGNAAFVDARARLMPTSGATWIDVGGTYAMFDSVGSPITQTFGLGLFSPASEGDLATLEAFFLARGADINHEVSPLGDPALLAMLSGRGYHPIEVSSVLYRPFGVDDLSPSDASGVTVRRMAPGEEDRWIETSAQGWGETPELRAFIREFGSIGTRAEGNVCFFAEWDGEPIATGAVALHDGVAHMAGASTRPEWRRRGAQGALLAARLRYAAEHRCDFALMAAAPGSTSQQNAERAGFRIAYSRIKWHRPRTA